MADYSNKVFKPRKDSGFVIKLRLTPDKADETQKDREQNIDKVNDYDFPCAAYVNGKFV